MKIEYLTAVGEASVIHDLDDVPADGEWLLGCKPIRKPGAYRGQRSKPGWYAMASTGRLVSFESKFERTALVRYDFFGTVAAVVPQPFRLHFERTSAPCRHVPDFLILHTDDRIELIDVKGSRARTQPQVRLAFTLTERACDTLGWDFTVYTEPDPVEAANLAYLAGYRGPLLHRLDTHLDTLTRILTPAPRTVADTIAALTAAGLPAGIAPAVVWRASWAREVRFALEAPLSDHTILTATSHDEGRLR